MFFSADLVGLASPQGDIVAGIPSILPSPRIVLAFHRLRLSCYYYLYHQDALRIELA